MRRRPERLTAYSALAALALGAAGTLFERATPSVLAADAEEFRAWARSHHDALVAQSVVFSASGPPLLLFFAGLRAVLRQQNARAGASSVDLSLVVLGGGALWVTAQLVGQALQVSMATAAAHAEQAGFVASLSDLMRSVLALGNVPLAAALACCAAIGFRDRALPRWLASLSALTAVVHLVPVAPERMRKGLLSSEGPGAYLPYPVFVAWMVGVAVTELRRARSPRTA